MIGLMFMAAAVFWLVVALLLAIKIPSWLSIQRFRWQISLLLFPVLLVLPFVDELIGRYQFKKLCEREAVVTLSPNWKNVKWAKEMSAGPIYLKGYVISIREWSIRYIDADTGDDLFLSRAFITNGGILRSRLGFGLGQSTSCKPQDQFEIMDKINIHQLTKQGESK